PHVHDARAEGDVVSKRLFGTAGPLVSFSYFVHYPRYFFFNAAATAEIYPLSLHDALPICRRARRRGGPRDGRAVRVPRSGEPARDRKSTRLNSSHLGISYAVFCLKKKKRGSGDSVELPRDAASSREPAVPIRGSAASSARG